MDNCGVCMKVACCAPCMSCVVIDAVIEKGMGYVIACMCFNPLFCVCPDGCLLAPCVRNRLAEKYGIEESNCHSCLVSYCCGSCSLCQMVQEIEERSVPGGQSME